MNLFSIALSIVTVSFLLLPKQAKADIVMINLNGSTQEVEALRKLTAKNKERLYVIPEDASDDTYDTEDVAGDLLDLARKGVRPRSVVISGHHYQDQYFYGDSGSLFLHKLSAALGPSRAEGSVRAFFDGVQSLYLWGCYSGTLGNTDKLISHIETPFNSLNHIVGFLKKGPLGVTKESGILLERAFDKETLLRRSSPTEKVSVLKTIVGSSRYDLIVHQGDAYFTANESSSRINYQRTCATPAALAKFAADNKTLYKYYNGEASIPADTAGGPLRGAYEDLQEYKYCLKKNNICAANQSGYQYKAIPVETAIRLVYYKKVMANFAYAYASRLQYVHTVLQLYKFKNPDFLLQLGSLDRAVVIQKLADLNEENYRLNYDDENVEKAAAYFFVREVLKDIRRAVYTAGASIPSAWTSSKATTLGYFKVLNDIKGTFARSSTVATCLVEGCREDYPEFSDAPDEIIAPASCVR